MVQGDIKYVQDRYGPVWFGRFNKNALTLAKTRKIDVAHVCDQILEDINTESSPVSIKSAGNLLLGVTKVLNAQTDDLLRETEALLTNQSTYMRTIRSIEAQERVQK